MVHYSASKLHLKPIQCQNKMKHIHHNQCFIFSFFLLCFLFSFISHFENLDKNKTHRKGSNQPKHFPLKTVESIQSPEKIHLNVLSIDWHISPIADLKEITSLFFPHVHIVDYSLSGSCHTFNTCAGEKLKVLTTDPSHSLYLNLHTKIEFYEEYKFKKGNDNFMHTTHAMICSHPSGMCELAMPFNKTIILWITTRFEQGRENSLEKFKGLVQNFRIVKEKSNLFAAANNWYDVHYFNYYTGLKAKYIPSYCNYTNTVYSWNHDRTILVHGYRPILEMIPLEVFLKDLNQQSSKFSFKSLRKVYPGKYEYKDIASHPAILHIPYQVSIMSFFEHYRMCIPIIAPSLKLLTEWHMQYRIVSELTWNLALNKITDPSGSTLVLPKHKDADPFLKYDPNNDHDETSVNFWLQFSDYYKFPHIILFDNWQDLIQKLNSVDLIQISKEMCAFNSIQLSQIQESWKEIFDNVNIPESTEQWLSYESQMNLIYGEHNWVGY